MSEQEARRAVVDEAIAWFRQSVEGVLKTVADSLAAMKSTATMLSATSNETTTHTAGAVHTSNEAFGSVDIASTAANELSKSIAEINRQLVRGPAQQLSRDPRASRQPNHIFRGYVFVLEFISSNALRDAMACA